MKYLQTYNESIKNVLKPKSKDDIINISKKLNPIDLLTKGSEYGITWMVKKSLEKNIDPTSYDNYALEMSCQYGYIDIVKLLLQDKRVDPSFNHNYPIYLSCKYGHIDIVKLLLQDERVDPSDRSNISIQYASKYGHIDIVKLLLQDERVDPSDSNNFAIYNALKNNHFDIVKLLLQDERVINMLKDNTKNRFNNNILKILYKLKSI